MGNKVKSYRLNAQSLSVIEKHQRRMNFQTETEAIEDIIARFNKSQQSRIRKLLEKDPKIERVLLSDFLGTFQKIKPLEAIPNPEA